MTNFDDLQRQLQAARPALWNNNDARWQLPRTVEALNFRWVASVLPMVRELHQLALETVPDDEREDFLARRNAWGNPDGAEHRIEVEWTPADTRRIAVSYGYQFPGFDASTRFDASAHILCGSPRGRVTLPSPANPIFFREQPRHELDDLVADIFERAKIFGATPRKALRFEDVPEDVRNDGSRTLKVPGLAFMGLPLDDMLDVEWPNVPAEFRLEWETLRNAAADEIQAELLQTDHERPWRLGHPGLTSQLAALRLCARLVNRSDLFSEVDRQTSTAATELPRRELLETRLSRLSKALHASGASERSAAIARQGINILTELPREHVQFRTYAASFGNALESAGLHGDAVTAFLLAVEAFDAHPSQYNSPIPDGISAGRNLRLDKQYAGAIKHLEAVRERAAKERSHMQGKNLAGVQFEALQCHLAANNHRGAAQAQAGLIAAVEQQLGSYRDEGVRQRLSEMLTKVIDLRIERREYADALRVAGTLGSVAPPDVAEWDNAGIKTFGPILNDARNLRSGGRTDEAFDLLDGTSRSRHWRVPEPVLRELIVTAIDVGRTEYVLPLLATYKDRYPAGGASYGFEVGFGSVPRATSADDWHLAISREEFVDFAAQRLGAVLDSKGIDGDR